MRLRNWLAARRPRRRRARPAILMYHRVAALARDPWGLAVSPENFAEQLALLRRHRTVMPLEDLLRMEREGCLPPRAIAITFDDGYRDNLTNAAPALAAAGMPATLFLATGPMRRQRGYWWDVLESMVLDAGPVRGSVRIGATDVAIVLGPSEAADGIVGGWRAWHPPRAAREALYIRLWSTLRPLPPGGVEETMAALETVLPARLRAADRPMNEHEVRQLLGGSPFALACHTVDHPDLSAVSPRIAREQLAAGKTEVEAIAGRAVTGFAYPYGRFDAAVERLVADAGFAYACTTASGEIAGSGPLSLPRLTAQNRPMIDWLEA